MPEEAPASWNALLPRPNSAIPPPKTRAAGVQLPAEMRGRRNDKTKTVVLNRSFDPDEM